MPTDACIDLSTSSWPGLSRPSTSLMHQGRMTWMPGTRPGITSHELKPFLSYECNFKEQSSTSVKMMVDRRALIRATADGGTSAEVQSSPAASLDRHGAVISTSSTVALFAAQLRRGQDASDQDDFVRPPVDPQGPRCRRSRSLGGAGDGGRGAADTADRIGGRDRHRQGLLGRGSRALCRDA